MDYKKKYEMANAVLVKIQEIIDSREIDACDGYKDGYVANHIDHDRLNNRADNLEWCTQKENTNTTLFKKHLSEALLSSNRVKRKRVRQLSKNGELLHIYPSLAKAAEDHEVKQPSLSACCLGETKTCKGYKWEYENEND